MRSLYAFQANPELFQFWSEQELEYLQHIDRICRQEEQGKIAPGGADLLIEEWREELVESNPHVIMAINNQPKGIMPYNDAITLRKKHAEKEINSYWWPCNFPDAEAYHAFLTKGLISI